MDIPLRRGSGPGHASRGPAGLTRALGLAYFLSASLSSNSRGASDAPLPLPPLPGIERAPSASPAAQAELKADAGEDELTWVGRRVRLEGRCIGGGPTPGFRWVQLSGPATAEVEAVGARLSVTPKEQGVYRFALLVAEGSRISEPDGVNILVTAEAPAALKALMSGGGSAPTARPDAGPRTYGEIARKGLSRLGAGEESGQALMLAFEDISTRVALYQNYSDVLQGSSTRLAAIVPADPARYAEWNEAMLAPLSQRLAEEMKGAGLDLSRAENLSVAMSPAQKERLASCFRAMAAGFREAVAGRGTDAMTR